MVKMEREPSGELLLKTLAMPADTNPDGDIFGGWVLSQMDIAAAIAAGQRACGRVATVAVDAMKFHRPVYVGDVLCVFGDVGNVGRTSLSVSLEAWAARGTVGDKVLVTEGVFTFVAIGADKRPRLVDQPEAK